VLVEGRGHGDQDRVGLAQRSKSVVASSRPVAAALAMRAVGDVADVALARHQELALAGIQLETHDLDAVLDEFQGQGKPTYPRPTMPTVKSLFRILSSMTFLQFGAKARFRVRRRDASSCFRKPRSISGPEPGNMTQSAFRSDTGVRGAAGSRDSRVAV
jgi:hypothetical protein